MTTTADIRSPRIAPGVLAALCAMAASCGTDNKNPYGAGPDTTRADAASTPAPGPTSGADAASTPRPTPGAADGGATPEVTGGGPTTPTPSGKTIPVRFIVLGDSIAACANVGNENGASCSAKKLFDHVKASYAPALVYQNVAVGGAVTEDVPARQLQTVTTGAGHALVLIYIGGNNLAKYLFSGDAVAERGYISDLPGVKASWEAIFAFFRDKTKFPDGATVLMNNQYNPFDGCTAAPYFLSAKKNMLLDAFNKELAAIASTKGASLTDQHTPFLGHGHHYSVTSCPHFKANLTPWMDDLIHPNAAGHENLFQQW
jgi:lysophospholipase L1-like esterase